MSKDNSNSFTSAFRQFLKEENLDTKYREKLLIASWETLMGKPIASRTTRIYIHHKVLHVQFSSAPLKQEMANNKDKVMALLKEDFSGLVEDIRIL